MAADQEVERKEQNEYERKGKNDESHHLEGRPLVPYRWLSGEIPPGISKMGFAGS